MQSQACFDFLFSTEQTSVFVALLVPFFSFYDILQILWEMLQDQGTSTGGIHPHKNTAFVGLRLYKLPSCHEMGHMQQ